MKIAILTKTKKIRVGNKVTEARVGQKKCSELKSSVANVCTQFAVYGLCFAFYGLRFAV